MKLFRSTVAVALLSVTLIGPASAVNIFVEGADAGDTIGTAADTTGLSPLNGIQGSLSLEPANGPDYVDVFKVTLPSGTARVFYTGNGTDTSLIADPVLYLFNSLGVGISMNDECCGNGQAALFFDLLVGEYYLAIAFAGVEPLDANGDSIFDAFGGFGVLSTDPLASWLEAPLAVDPATVGAYNISLVPEPGTLGLAALGLLGLCVSLSRRRLAA